MLRYKVISPLRDGSRLVKSGTFVPKSQEQADRLVLAGCLKVLEVSEAPEVAGELAPTEQAEDLGELEPPRTMDDYPVAAPMDPPKSQPKGKGRKSGKGK